MKKLLALAMMPFSAALANPMSSVAQEKFQASAGIELASSYVWRGQDLGNASIQPSLSLSWKGLSLSAWGSAGFSRNDTREVDLTICPADMESDDGSGSPDRRDMPLIQMAILTSDIDPMKFTGIPENQQSSTNKIVRI